MRHTHIPQEQRHSSVIKTFWSRAAVGATVDHAAVTLAESRAGFNWLATWAAGEKTKANVDLRLVGGLVREEATNRFFIITGVDLVTGIASYQQIDGYTYTSHYIAATEFFAAMGAGGAYDSPNSATFNSSERTWDFVPDALKECTIRANLPATWDGKALNFKVFFRRSSKAAIGGSAVTLTGDKVLFSLDVTVVANNTVITLPANSTGADRDIPVTGVNATNKLYITDATGGVYPRDTTGATLTPDVARNGMLYVQLQRDPLNALDDLNTIVQVEGIEVRYWNYSNTSFA